MRPHLPQIAPSLWLVLYVIFLVSLLFAFSLTYFTSSSEGRGDSRSSAGGVTNAS